MTEAVLPTTTSECEAAWLLRRSGDDDFIVRLADDKVTIGSGQSCNVRLTDAGVRPLHCLVTPGPHGLVVRRWSDGTLLNGETFAEAPLQPGDVLSIGPVDLFLELPKTAEPQSAAEVEDELHPTSDEADSSERRSSDEPLWTVDATVAAITEATAAIAEEQNHIAPLRESVQNNRSRARMLARLARRQRGENARLSAEVADLQARLAETQSEREQLTEERDELRTQLGALARDMIQVREELNARSVVDNDKISALERRLADLEQQIVDRDTLVNDLREELERRRELPETPHSAPPQPQAHVEPEAALADALRPADIETFTPRTKVDEATQDTSEPFELPEEEVSSAQVSDYPTQQIAEWSGRSDEAEEAEPVELSLDSTLPSEHLWGETAPSRGSTADENLWHSDPTPTATQVEPSPADSDPFAAVGAVESSAEQLASFSTSEAQTVSQPGPSAELDPPAIENLEDDPTPEADGDVWGRLSSLRAAASEKLHYEVEHSAEAASEPDPLWNMPLPESLAPEPEAVETDSLGELEEDGNAAEASIDDLWPETETSAELEEATVEPSTISEEDDKAEAIIPTTVFDAPAEKPAKEHEEPVSFVEKFKHLLDEDGSAEPTPAGELPAFGTPAAAEAGEPTDAGSDDDESIEEYMSKMMARLRGESAAEAPASAKPAAAASKSATVSASASSADSEKVSAASAARPNPLAEKLASGAMMPTPPERPLENLNEIKTSAKPEESTDMSTLRDLANSSAREAIKIANSRRYREVALTNVLMCVTGAIGGAYLVWTAGGQISLELFCGAGAIAGSAFWALRTARSLSDPSYPELKQVDPDESKNVLPIDGVEKR